jgi:hypothetical protein
MEDNDLGGGIVGGIGVVKTLIEGSEPTLAAKLQLASDALNVAAVACNFAPAPFGQAAGLVVSIAAGVVGIFAAAE